MDSLFDNQAKRNAPLYERMRPSTMDDFIGQEHIVNKNSLLSRAIRSDMLGSCIFFGPPGTGKTTLANIIANTTKSRFAKLNAVSSGVSDAKKVMDEAKQYYLMYGKPTYLLLDECHRWNKAQSDSVLSAIEEGYIIFIGSTTENPFIAMTRAIASRCRVFEFKPLSTQNLKDALNRAILDKQNGLGNLNIKIDEDALNHLAWASNGDLRCALNALELAVKTTPLNKQNVIHITKQVASESIQQKVLSTDENMYYDMLSAFCKSIRGSDADAALYWSNRLIIAGCDPLLIARRLIAHCSEDIGMADSNALLLATSALIALKNMGLPEGNIPLSHAIIYACEAPKSNSVVVAIDKAKYDVEHFGTDKVPNHLKNHPTLDYKVPYKYPHDFGGYVYQQYLPDAIKDHIYYIPSQNGREKGMIRRKIFKPNQK